MGARWATIEAVPSYWTTDDRPDAGLVIGLRPASPGSATPGTSGGVGFGFETYAPIEQVATHFTQRGVRVEGDIITFEAGRVVAFVDLDGLPSYAWEPDYLVGSERVGTAASGVSGGRACRTLAGAQVVQPPTFTNARARPRCCQRSWMS